MAEKKLSTAYISEFCKELGNTVSSGIPISDGIFMLSEYDNDKTGAALLNQLLRDTEKGVSFSSAIRRTKQFPQYVEEMIEIGERTGRLDSVLLELAAYYRRQDDISRSIKNAVMFPSVLLIILVGIIVVLLTQVLPIFRDVFAQLGVDVSGSAAALMNIGDALSSYGVIIIGIVAALALVAAVLSGIPATRRLFKNIFAHGKIIRQIESTRFASAMAMTLASGMDIDDSLNMSKKLCDKEMCGKIDECAELMKKGKSFDKAVSETEIFNPVNSRRITISFKTGRTDKAMSEIAEDGERKLNEAIDEKISRVEPTLVVVMSLFVGLILVSVMLPMISIITSV